MSGARRWPQVLIGVAVIGVLVAAVVFVATSDREVAHPNVPDAAAPATMRQCVQRPVVTTTTTTTTTTTAVPVDPLAGEEAAAPTTTMAPRPDLPPNGTYLATLVPVGGPDAVELTVLTEGGRTYRGVPLATGLAVPTGPIGGAVTVDAGTVTAVDTERVTWDDDLGRGNDPCAPRTGCVLTGDPVPHAWPGGVNGLLGDDIRTVPERLSSVLAKWGVNVDPLAFMLLSRPCVLGASVGSLQLQLDLELTDDGYVLAHATTDAPDDPAIALSYSATGDSVSLPIPPEFAEQSPDATVSAAVRFGDRAVKASVPVTSQTLDVTIDRSPNQRGAIVLTYRAADGSLLRLVAFQIPAGDSAAS